MAFVIPAVAAIGSAVGTAAGAVGTAATAIGTAATAGGTASALGLVSTAASAAGTLASYRGQRVAASTQGRIEQYNQNIAARNAIFGRSNAYTQAAFLSAQAQANQRYAALQYEALQRQLDYREKEAELQQDVYKNNIRLQALLARAAETRGRETVRRTRHEGRRHQALVRGRFARAGVVGETGSPLEVLADTARLIELSAQDAAYASELEAKGHRDEARALNFQKEIAALASGYEIQLGRAQSQIDYQAQTSRYRLEELSATTARRQADRDYRLANYAALNQPSRVPALRAQANATLISGLSSTFDQGRELGVFG